MPQPTDADRIALAEAWIAQDPDPETRDELSALVERTRSGDAAAGQAEAALDRVGERQGEWLALGVAM